MPNGCHNCRLYMQFSRLCLRQSFQIQPKAGRSLSTVQPFDGWSPTFQSSAVLAKDLRRVFRRISEPSQKKPSLPNLRCWMHSNLHEQKSRHQSWKAVLGLLSLHMDLSQISLQYGCGSDYSTDPFIHFPHFGSSHLGQLPHRALLF